MKQILSRAALFASRAYGIAGLASLAACMTSTAALFIKFAGNTLLEV